MESAIELKTVIISTLNSKYILKNIKYFKLHLIIFMEVRQSTGKEEGEYVEGDNHVFQNFCDYMKYRGLINSLMK